MFGCESDAFADGTTLSSCQYNDNFQMPPQPIADLNDHTWKTVNGVLGVFGMLTPYTDPVVCPVLRQLPGNYPGGLTIGPNGYLHFSDPLGVVEVTYECPPAGSSRR
ncbi:MAG: hypothetical protein JO079_07805 [Frankiaceae bacterium]|nr:hypothetical protein [Frankiaceae bacterium]